MAFQSYNGERATRLYQAKVCKVAINLHLASGGKMRLARNAAPTKLVKLAGAITGESIPPRGYAKAIEALSSFIGREEAALIESGEVTMATR